MTWPATAGTATNPIVFSNSIQVASGDVYSVNNDTGWSRTAAGIFAVGNGTAADTTAKIKAAAYMSVGTLSNTPDKSRTTGPAANTSRSR